MIAFVIVACEIGFWLVLVAGMLLRYPLNRPRAGAVLLAGVPLVDAVLLVATGVDLRRGADFHVEHGLAALYLGFSLAFGHQLVRAADRRFAHRFAGGPPPEPKPAVGTPARAALAWAQWRRGVVAATIATAVLLLLAAVMTSHYRGDLGDLVAAIWAGVVVWLVTGPVRHVVGSTRVVKSQHADSRGRYGRD